MEQNFQDNTSNTDGGNLNGNGSSMAKLNSQNAIQAYNVIFFEEF